MSDDIQRMLYRMVGSVENDTSSCTLTIRRRWPSIYSPLLLASSCCPLRSLRYVEVARQLEREYDQSGLNHILGSIELTSSLRHIFNSFLIPLHDPINLLINPFSWHSLSAAIKSPQSGKSKKKNQIRRVLMIMISLHCQATHRASCQLLNAVY
jgi:hypothetical protein